MRASAAPLVQIARRALSDASPASPGGSGRGVERTSCAGNLLVDGCGERAGTVVPTGTFSDPSAGSAASFYRPSPSSWRCSNCSGLRCRCCSRGAVAVAMTSALQFVIEHPFGLTPGVRCRLGDAELTALVKLREFSLGGERAALLSLVGGARIPTGAHELAGETGARREKHLQPGTGAWSGVLGADLLLPLRVGRIDLNASYRKNGVNSVRYGYGDVFLYNAGFARRLGNVLELSLQANGRSARRDDTNGISLEHSCGSVLYASPVARVFTSVGVVLEAGAQFPVSSALHGRAVKSTRPCGSRSRSLVSVRRAHASTKKLGMIWGTSQGPRPKGAWRVGVLRAPSRVWGATGPGSIAARHEERPGVWPAKCGRSMFTETELRHRLSESA